MEDEGLLDNAAAVGTCNLHTQLWAELHGLPGVREVRGKGLMIGAELITPCGVLVNCCAGWAAAVRDRRPGDPPGAADPVARRSRRHQAAGALQRLPERDLRMFIASLRTWARTSTPDLFERADFIKRKFKAVEKYQPFADPDRTLAMIFEEGQYAHARQLRGRHVPTWAARRCT